MMVKKTLTDQTRILLRIDRGRKNMTFKVSFLQVHFPKISLLCTKVREGFFRSLFVEADFLSSAIFSSECFFQLGTGGRYSVTNGSIEFLRVFCLLCRADIPSLKFLLTFAARFSFLSLFFSFENYVLPC